VATTTWGGGTAPWEGRWRQRNQKELWPAQEGRGQRHVGKIGGSFAHCGTGGAAPRLRNQREFRPPRKRTVPRRRNQEGSSGHHGRGCCRGGGIGRAAPATMRGEGSSADRPPRERGQRRNAGRPPRKGGTTRNPEGRRAAGLEGLAGGVVVARKSKIRV
jgi:hypothetical protein